MARRKKEVQIEATPWSKLREYRASYEDGRTCGDWLATALSGVSFEDFLAIAKENGLKTTGYSGNRGSQAMSIRNRLRGTAKEQGFILLNGKKVKAPK